MLPIGFFAVGAMLAEKAEDGELPSRRRSRPVAARGRHPAGRSCPAPADAAAAPLIDLPASYLLIAAMPCGINSLLVAHIYGLDMEITAEAVTWSTAIVVGASLVSLFV